MTQSFATIPGETQAQPSRDSSIRSSKQFCIGSGLPMTKCSKLNAVKISTRVRKAFLDEGSYRTLGQIKLRPSAISLHNSGLVEALLTFSHPKYRTLAFSVPRWMRGTPQVEFSDTLRKMSSPTSLLTHLLPARVRCREIQVQLSWNPARCQRTTVSGWTRINARFQPGHSRRKITQNSRSEPANRGRGCFLFKTPSCCRSARFSKIRLVARAKTSGRKNDHEPH